MHGAPEGVSQLWAYNVVWSRPSIFPFIRASPTEFVCFLACIFSFSLDFLLESALGCWAIHVIAYGKEEDNSIALVVASLEVRREGRTIYCCMYVDDAG
jgi:hypothetical protein